MQRDTRDGRRAIGVAALFVALSLLFVSPVFRHVKNFGALDWDANFFILGAPRVSVAEYGQFPLWNPYEWGGLPLLAMPWSRCLSPSFLLALVMEPVMATKVDIWLHSFAGLGGAYLLARDHSLSRVASIVAACAYLCSGWYPMVVTSGMSVFLGAAFIPWAFVALRRARDDPRFIVALALVWVLMFVDGAVEPLAILAVSLAVHEAVDIARGKTTFRSSLRIAAGSTAIFAAVSAIKLFPSIASIQDRPRLIARVGGYSVESLLLSLLQRGQTLFTDLPRGSGFWRGANWGTDETGAYVGAGVAILFALGVYRKGREHAHLAIALLLLVWTSMGVRSPFGPWALIHSVPPFSFMRAPERFRFAFLLDLALFAGVGFDVLRDELSRSPPPQSRSGRRQWIAAAVAAAVVADLIVTNGAVFRDAFGIPPVAVPRHEEFVQIRRLPPYDERGFLTVTEHPSPLAPSSSLYPALVAGVGTAKGFSPLAIRSGLRVGVLGEPGYRGEEWLVGTPGLVRRVRWTPNALTYDVDAKERGLLVVNQAYSPGWRARSGLSPRAEGENLAVPIPAGRTRVELYYRPTSFVIGALVSSLSSALLAGFFWQRERRRGASDENRTTLKSVAGLAAGSVLSVTLGISMLARGEPPPKTNPARSILWNEWGPTVTATATQVPNVSVAAKVHVIAKQVGDVRVRYGPDSRYGLETPPAPVPRDGNVVVTIIGLRPDSVTHFEVVGRAPDGAERSTGDLTVQTGPMPAGLPAVLDVESIGRASGHVLLSVNDLDDERGFAVMIDRAGRVEWYRPMPHRVSVVDRLANGHIMMHRIGPGDFEEIELDGTIVRKWGDPQSEAGTDEHDFKWLPDNHLLLIGQEVRTIDTRGIFAGGTEHATRFDQTVTEIAPNGSVVSRWSTFGRVSESEITDDPAKPSNPRDYEVAHLNSIDPTPDGNLLLSLRDISAVLKIDRSSGSIMYRLGGKNSDFRFVNDPLGGFSRQHDARWLPNGHVLLFDNGNLHDPPESRAAEYALDEGARTATLVWQHRRSPPLFASIAGSARRLPNGNTLIAYGPKGIVREVDGASEFVWELRSPGGVFRATVVPTLYP